MIKDRQDSYKVMTKPRAQLRKALKKQAMLIMAQKSKTKANRLIQRENLTHLKSNYQNLSPRKDAKTSK